MARKVPAERTPHIPQHPSPITFQLDSCPERKRHVCAGKASFRKCQNGPESFAPMEDEEVKEEVKHKPNGQTRALGTSYEASGKEQRSLDARLLT
jgi:hypothetical protein